MYTFNIGIESYLGNFGHFIGKRLVPVTHELISYIEIQFDCISTVLFVVALQAVTHPS